MPFSNGGSPLGVMLPVLGRGSESLPGSSEEFVNNGNKDTPSPSPRLPTLGKPSRSPIVRSLSARSLVLSTSPTRSPATDRRLTIMTQANDLISTIQGLGGSSIRPSLTLPLGQGGFGSVYRGVWRGLDVVVKTVSFDGSELAEVRANGSSVTGNRATLLQALTEASVCAALDHPNIVCLYHHDFYPQPSSKIEEEPSADRDSPSSTDLWHLSLVQEYCDGGTLKDVIRSQRIQAIAAADGWAMAIFVLTSMLLDVATALEYCHTHSVVHGDVNPNNILLKRDASRASATTAKLADFGMAVVLENGQSSVVTSCTGTACYTAPEVLDSRVLSRAADAFSFGVIMWEVFTGEPPWVRNSLDGTYSTNESRGVFRSVSPPQLYRSVCEACLAVKPADRPAFSFIRTELSQLKLRCAARLQSQAAKQGSGGVNSRDKFRKANTVQGICASRA